MIFRNATISDLNEMQELYIETIQLVCKNDYNPDQINAWISGVKNTNRWIEVIQTQLFYLPLLKLKSLALEL